MSEESGKYVCLDSLKRRGATARLGLPPLPLDLPWCPWPPLSRAYMGSLVEGDMGPSLARSSPFVAHKVQPAAWSLGPTTLWDKSRRVGKQDTT